ncbi:uncharacterized protein L201_005143 [Kwoniella dendrophila CBS 6074]|uniref:F-box domain-containing protein n=1 Tax=Kwoniella dendrophila CBS 6074 TaxID=1295534 RepID=A0AAX4K077_9TREE
MSLHPHHKLPDLTALESWKVYTSSMDLTNASILESVFHVILEHLSKESPLTLGGVSRFFNRLVTPRIYRSLKVDVDNVRKVLHGFAIIPAFDMFDDFLAVKWSTTHYKKRLAMFEHVSLLTLTDLESLELLMMLAKSLGKFTNFMDTPENMQDFPDDENNTDSTSPLKSSPMIFKNVQHLKNGRELARSLMQIYASSTTTKNPVKHISKLCQPKSICFEWPSGWEEGVSSSDLHMISYTGFHRGMESTTNRAFAAFMKDIREFNNNPIINFRFHLSTSDMVDTEDLELFTTSKYGQVVWDINADEDNIYKLATHNAIISQMQSCFNPDV